MLEVSLTIAAILLILSSARFGVFFGVFYEMTSALLLFFAMMVTLRYWYEVTQWIESVLPGAGAYGVFGAYWGLFLVGCLPLILALNRITQRAAPRYPKIVDNVLGIVFGAVAATILVCCIFTSLSVVGPKVWEPYNRDALTVPFDRLPVAVYEHIEEQWLGIAKTDPGHTRLPTFDKANQDDPQKYWR